MTESSRPTAAPPPPTSEDPIVAVFREHTDLQVLAARLHEVAASLERPDRAPATDAAEGVEVHRRFVLEVHLPREAAIAAALHGAAPPEVTRALERCRAEHEASIAFGRDARRLLAESPLSADGRRQLIALLRSEADRLVEHHREEDETIYRPMHHRLLPDQLARLQASARELAGAAAAAQERLSAWSSRLHASAD